MNVLGIDPGYDRVGWAIIDKEKGNTSLVSCGAITTNKADTPAQRLHDVFTGIENVISTYKPSSVSIESLFFTNNAKTAMGVSQARGVILLACQIAGLTITELTPSQIKSAVTGNGQADKKAVEKMVRLILKDVPDKLLDDTLDAIAAALA